MSYDQNQAVLAKVITEAFNKQNYAVIPECYHPDFIEHQFGAHPTYAGVEELISSLHRSFPDFSLTIEEMASSGDRVWIRLTARGTNTNGFMGAPNGKSFQIAIFDECRFENGRIVEHWGAPDRFALMAQLDLLPHRPGQ